LGVSSLFFILTDCGYTPSRICTILHTARAFSRKRQLPKFRWMKAAGSTGRRFGSAGNDFHSRRKQRSPFCIFVNGNLKTIRLLAAWRKSRNNRCSGCSYGSCWFRLLSRPDQPKRQSECQSDYEPANRVKYCSFYQPTKNCAESGRMAWTRRYRYASANNANRSRKLWRRTAYCAS
jgi:hypothetical protein